MYAISAELYVPLEDMAVGSTSWYLEFGFADPVPAVNATDPADVSNNCGKPVEEVPTASGA